MSRSRILPSGRVAAFDADPFRPGALVLSIDGAEQSHLDPADPELLDLEYARRIGFAIDAAAAPGVPLRVLHLGGGALTLARYVAHTRPGSVQHVVEAEKGLTAFVTETAPLPLGTLLNLHEGDALIGIPHGQRFELIVVDVYLGITVPEHLRGAGFARTLSAALSPGGIVIANIADDAGLPLSRQQHAAFSSVFAQTAIVAPPAALAGRSEANVILLAAGPLTARSREDAGGLVAGIVEAMLREGPHPVAAG